MIRIISEFTDPGMVRHLFNLPTGSPRVCSIYLEGSPVITIIHIASTEALIQPQVISRTPIAIVLDRDRIGFVGIDISDEFM